MTTSLPPAKKSNASAILFTQKNKFSLAWSQVCTNSLTCETFLEEQSGFRQIWAHLFDVAFQTSVLLSLKRWLVGAIMPNFREYIPMKT